MLSVAANWLTEEPVALATVVRTWGSSPRRPGSQMVIAGSGRMAGSVSGGCIEVAVAEAAHAVIGTGVAQLLCFGVSDQQAWQVGLACGGEVQVFVERLDGSTGMVGTR